MDYVNINENNWDKWANTNCIWTLPITHEEFTNAKKGDFDVYLTPLKKVPREWYFPVYGKRVLGLASGGGQQCPLFVAGGAEVTVYDISSQQLDTEKRIARREGYPITLIKGDMTKKLPFDDESFDMIFHPVSNSYIENVSHVWKECYRILKHGGILLSGFANPTIYLYKMLHNEYRLFYKMPYNPFCDLSKEEIGDLFDKDGVQFGHSFDEQIAGQIDAGFAIIGFYEDFHPLNNDSTNYDTYIGKTAGELTKYMPIYFSTKSIKL